MTIKAKLEWKEKMQFAGQAGSSPSVLLDNPDGKTGPTPMEMLLMGVAGCTAMDVVAILKKMRVEIESLNVVVEGDLTDDYPKHFSRMHVIYEFTGKDLPVDKLQKAIDLSSEKYCGVSAVYRKAMEMTSEILIKETI